MSRGGVAAGGAESGRTPSGTSANEENPAGPALHSFIRRGRSFSGRERNCCFLNIGASLPPGDAQHFANISAVSGFDFADDGRALARVDWDLDGDLDLWVANRSGPQVRFLRNDLAANTHHLSLLLVGTHANRDAIGARAEVILEGKGQSGQPRRTLARTVVAGDGFLAQSSRWLHFGLGPRSSNAKPSIAEVRVRWPSVGKASVVEETFTGVEVDGRYRVIEGTGRVVPWILPRRTIALEPAAQREPPSSERMRVVTAARLPVPRLSYTSFGGETRSVHPAIETSANGRPTLVLLWASWCAPCVAELAELAQRADEVRSTGPAIVALAVDRLEDKPETNRSNDPSAIVKKYAFPFEAGYASDAAVDTLQRVHDRLFDLQRPFPVPVSFLIDPSGALAAIYRGRVEVDTLLRDTAKMKSKSLLHEALPFGGRWLRAPGRISPFALTWELVESDAPHAGIEYMLANQALLRDHIRYPQLAVLAGNARLASGQAASAATFYRQALARSANYVDAQNNLAWVLATSRDDRLRNGREAVRLAESAVRLTGERNLSMWGTLAAAYAEAGDFDQAVKVTERTINTADQTRQVALANRLRQRLEVYRKGKPHRSP